MADPLPPRTIVAGAGGDGAAVVLPPEIEPPAPVANWMTIAQAREQGWPPGKWTTNGAFRTAKSRARRNGVPVPKVQAMRGTEALYDAVELADFLERETAGKGACE